MILAAGRGERMRPLTDHVPKPLLLIAGKPLIVWHLERLSQAGFKEVVINHAHLGEMIEAALKDGAQWGMRIRYSSEPLALETAGGIANALNLLGGDPFLVVNGDVFTDIPFAELKLSRGKLAHLVLIDNPPQHTQGDFAFANERITLNGEPKLTFSGVGIYHPALFAGLVRGKPAKLAPLLKQAIADSKVTAEHFNGIWHDIGTPERLMALNQQLLGHS